MSEDSKIPGKNGGWLTPFKPGQSGNPKGKPKGRKDIKTLLDEVAYGDMTDPVTGLKMPALQLMLLIQCRAALDGNLRAMKFVADRLEGPVNKVETGLQDVTPELNETQLSIAKRYAEKIVEQHKKGDK